LGISMRSPSSTSDDHEPFYEPAPSSRLSHARLPVRRS
jgi:hypothetical protein